MKTNVFFLLIFVSFCANANHEGITDLKRASGLWKILITDTPLFPAGWYFCALHEKDNLIHTDLWRDFDKECDDTGSSYRNGIYYLNASCEGGFEMKGELSGNLTTAYSFKGTASYVHENERHTDYYALTGKYAGECPADLSPGSKRMHNKMLIEGFYE